MLNKMKKLLCYLLILLTYFHLNAQTPQLVQDINQGVNSSSPLALTNVNGTLFFYANNGINGYELWKSDGTNVGTFMLKDIYPGNSIYFQNYLININGTLFFDAWDGTNNGLWKSDGTDNGTVLIKKLQSITGLTNVNGTLFFFASDNTNEYGYELWKSDGTENGTIMVKDINLGINGSGPSFPIYGNLAINNIFYFKANDGVHGVELWKSDGTVQGTTIVKDLNIGNSDSNINNLINVDGTLYFTATDGVNQGLWKCDGSANGTGFVTSKFYNFINVNSTLYSLYYAGPNGTELWKSDGTSSGTVLVKAFNNHLYGGYSLNLINVDGTLFLTTAVISPETNIQSFGLWKSDGTINGTILLADFPSDPLSFTGWKFNLTNVDGILYFIAKNATNGMELWKSDGTISGTTVVSDINVGVNSSNPSSLTTVNGDLFFTADDGINGVELWELSSNKIKLNFQLAVSGGLSTLTAGKNYTLEFGLKNNGRNSWQGDIYWKLNNGTYRLSSSNVIINSGNSGVYNVLFTPLPSEVGTNLPVELYIKKFGSSTYDLVGTINGTQNPINISIKLPSTDVEKPLPFIRLDKSLYLPSEVVRITGGNFIAGEVVSVATDIALPSVLPTLTVQADGRVSGTFTIPSNAKEIKIKVKVLDEAGNNPEWQAFIKQSETATLQITKPYKANSIIVIEEDGNATIEFIDKLLPNYTSAKISNTRRNYQYQIGYRLSSSNTIINLATTTLKNDINFSKINDKVQVQLPISQFPIGNKNIIFVISDVYDNLRVAESPEITIQTVGSTIKVSKKWDFSFTPSLINDPIGIAADGVARIYLVVEKKAQTGSPINSVSVSLSSSEGINDPSWLGRIKFATVQNNNAYSEEANGIVTITAQNNSAQIQNWFWYVAPDDFMRNGMTYTNESEREVTATFTISFADGSSILKTHKITIVRPPVILVHGLGGGAESTWNKFPLKTSAIFKQIEAVNMYPNQYYLQNAFVLLGNIPEKLSSSLPYQLQKMRQKRYACSQLDYVCHSMGGAMFRSLIDNYQARYYQTGTFSNLPNKTYGKGFVNKFITIDTPHNGSPWADLITTIAPLLPLKAKIALSGYTWYSANNDNFSTGLNAFIKPTDETVGNIIQSFEATNAVKNLQVIAANDGIDFKELIGIPSHLIAGDVVQGNQSIPDMEGSFLDVENYNKYFKLFYHICDYIADNKKNGNEPAWLNSFKDYVQARDPEMFKKMQTELDKARMVTKVMEMFCLFAFRYSNILVDGDIIVPLTSQTAGITSGNGISVLNDKSIDLSKFHTNITEDNSTSNEVKRLLNEAASSSYFITSIPSKVQVSASFSLPNFEKDKNLQLNISTIPQRPVVESFDKTKIEIISPTRLSNLKVGQNFPVRVQVKDLVNLKRVELSFQNNIYGDTLQNQYYNFYPTLETNLLGKQLLIATATYIRNDTVFFKMDTLSINAMTDEIVEVFSVNPKFNNIGLDEKLKPTFDIGYGKYVSNYIDYSKLGISISNTTSLGYDNTNHIFKGLQKGESQVIFTYEDKKDTIYVAVADGGNAYTSTIATGIVNSSSILCSGDPIQLSYTTTGTFGAGNEFLIQVSDINGDNFQTLETTQGSQLTAYLPTNMNAGTTYKVRIVSTNDPIIGSISSSSLTIKATPPAPNIIPSTINSGQNTILTVTNCIGTVKWYSSTTGITVLATGTTFTTPALTTTTTYFADCTINSCISTIRGSGIITVNPNPCPLTQNISSNYSSGQIISLQASETLNNTGIIRTGASVFNRAGKSITLNPGFKVETGGNYKAYIGGCQN